MVPGLIQGQELRPDPTQGSLEAIHGPGSRSDGFSHEQRRCLRWPGHDGSPNNDSACLRSAASICPAYDAAADDAATNDDAATDDATAHVTAAHDATANVPIAANNATAYDAATHDAAATFDASEHHGSGADGHGTSIASYGTPRSPSSATAVLP